MPKWKGLNYFQLEQAHLKNVENTEEIAVFVVGFFDLIIFITLFCCFQVLKTKKTLKFLMALNWALSLRVQARKVTQYLVS